MSIDRCDHGHAQACELIEYPMAAPDPAPPHVERRQRRPRKDVGAYAECFVARAGENRAADGSIAVDLLSIVAERIDHVLCQRIELLGTVERDRRNRTLDLQGNELRHVVSPAASDAAAYRETERHPWTSDQDRPAAENRRGRARRAGDLRPERSRGPPAHRQPDRLRSAR